METYLQEEFFVKVESSIWDSRTYEDKFQNYLKQLITLKEILAFGIEEIQKTFVFFNIFDKNCVDVYYTIIEKIVNIYALFSILAKEVLDRNLYSVYYHCQRVIDDIINEYYTLILNYCSLRE